MLRLLVPTWSSRSCILGHTLYAQFLLEGWLLLSRAFLYIFSAGWLGRNSCIKDFTILGKGIM